jgi:hypothetical protein
MAVRSPKARHLNMIKNLLKEKLHTMRHRPRIGLFFLSAALTFGVLLATIGPRHFHRMKACAERVMPDKEAPAADQAK